MRRPDGHPWVAASLDLVMSPMAHLRPRLVSQAHGRVLEIGAGTGANFAHYDGIEHLCAIEPDPHMLRRARSRAEALPVSIEVVQAGAEALPFESASFDSVVATWVFCTIPDAQAAAAEIFRVLRPGGRLHFVEHVHNHHQPARAIQSALDPAWTRVAGGCHLDRDPVVLLEDAGFAVQDVRPWGPVRWTLFPLLRGDAVRR